MVVKIFVAQKLIGYRPNKKFVCFVTQTRIRHSIFFQNYKTLFTARIKAGGH